MSPPPFAQPAPLLFLLLFWLAAPAPRAATPQPAPDCRTDHEALGLWLETLASHNGPALPSLPAITWVELSGQAGWPTDLIGPVLELRLRRAILNGEILPADLAGRTARIESVLDRYATLNRLRQRAGKAPNRAPVLMLAVDADEPFDQVAPLLQAASQAGFDQLGLLAAHRDPAGPAPPAASSIDGALAEIQDSDTAALRQKRLADAMRRVMSPCPELVTVFNAMAYMDTEDRPATLAQQLPEALNHCGCRVELAALKKLIWHLIYSPPLSVRIVPLARPDEEQALRLKIPARQRWKQVLPELLRALGDARPQPLIFEQSAEE